MANERITEQKEEAYNEAIRRRNIERLQQDYEADPWSLQSSKNLGMSLVSTLLIANNYIDWSRAIKISLAEKERLDFVFGPSNKLAIDDPRYRKWKRCDIMVLAWLINSISKDLSQSFLYCTGSRELWEKLEARLWESNGPLLYSIKTQISSLKQGNMSVLQYFLRLKQLWEDLAYLRPVPRYDRGSIVKNLVNSFEEDKVLHFLTRLNDSYNSIRSQILLLNSIPSVNKAYSMVVRVEKQREMSHENVIEVVNLANQETDLESLKCNHCGKTKDTKE